MSIFNRIAHHHTINEAVSLKLNNKTVSDKTISKMAKKISNLTDQHEKFNALKSSLDIVKNIKETQARVKLTTLLLKEINVLSHTLITITI
ncbi:hypothetical protein CKQ84_18785 [Shewanella sp. WE21]|jgi:hypothetical protein|uniref:hypothetical protein n=1 Tax=Shewanella sp. WE21 TaxID=2029986 RepID=UPI000CF6AB3C|nr:hypothetical protein [Shewanella sp. WE21]AVI67728.1 hypothetical protein CKQ84_18785 [Shewanella sp. WE21]